jgi:hypothetical protein
MDATAVQITGVKDFFAKSRERYNIKLKRDSGLPPPWTADPYFQQWRFCHVFREDDKTTKWFREEVRSKLSGLAVVEATVIFRWFNRIQTGEIVKDLLLNGWDTEEARRRLTGVAPIVSGAYIIKTLDGVSKLDGILHCVDLARPQLAAMVPKWGGSLRAAWEDLTHIYYLGRFMSYEIVSDLRWTPVLEQADDIRTWANAGPGAARGLGWIYNGNPSSFNCNSQTAQNDMVAKMQDILTASMYQENWPLEWPKWEMREVEHGLCEYDKWCRAAIHKQTLKRRYHAV